ncbi:EamA family transporter [Saccharothrix isguenensis]
MSTKLGVNGAGAIAVAAMVCVQSGAAVSTWLFDTAGPMGTAWLRLCFGALFLLVWARPRLRGRTAGDYGVALGLGLVSAGMTICYFQAIDRIPLGTASALEYLGPLVVAFIGLRKWVDVLWPVLAAAGVLVLTNPWSASADLVGIAFGLGAGACLGLYVVLIQKVGDRFSGMDGLAFAVTAAAVCSGFAGAPQALPALTPGVIAGAALVALLLPVIPYALEMVALRRLTASSFATLMSIEPAIATVIGFVLLSQAPQFTQLLGIALVITAGIAATRRGSRSEALAPESELLEPNAKT